MLNLNKLDFTALEVSGRNYLKWVQDVKLNLTTKSLKATIEEPIDDEHVNEAQKVTAMFFIRRYIHDAFKTEYLTDEDAHTLWLALVNCFEHQTIIYLPEVRHDWQYLRFQDFKKQNELMMKNHQAQPTGSNAPPEAHTTNSSSHSQRKPYCGCDNGWQGPPWAHGPQNRDLTKGGNLTQKCQPLALKALNFKNKGKTIVQSNSTKLNMCYHCGSKDHSSRVCRANPEAIAKYHSHRETNFVHVEHLEDATATLDVSDFKEALAPMEE
ncbi:uncharacterized protein [Pyrus communis]|uniref:uncharacterized protein n=1 Tax=Pyrus communis TaxID=23211 RepID=UPI0035C1B231